MSQPSPAKPWDAAGVLVVARRTTLYPGKPILLNQRSRNVRSPLTWAPWGGRMELGESPAETALREMREESGYTGEIELLAESTWAHRVGAVGSFHLFTFHNFIGVVEDQFEPPGVPNWEVADARWMSLDELDALAGPGVSVSGRPGGAHRGLRTYLSQPHARAILADLCKSA